MPTVACRIGLLAEDPLLTELLAESLANEEGLALALATADPQQLLASAAALDVVVADLPPPEAARLREALRAARPQLGLVLLGGPLPSEAGPPVLRAERRLGRAELLRAIRAAAPGAGPASASPPGADEASRLSRLTPRQLQVLAAVGLGQDNATIAGQLGITPRTVKAHLALLYRQLSAANRVQLALLAQRNRLRSPVPVIAAPAPTPVAPAPAPVPTPVAAVAPAPAAAVAPEPEAAAAG